MRIRLYNSTNYVCFCIFLLFCQCSENVNKPGSHQLINDTVSGKPQKIGVDTLAVKNVRDFVTKQYLTPTDLDIIPISQRTFQMYQTDLNQDGLKEIFVGLFSPYFCGSGGCTILLLSPDFELITKFTVIEPPLYISTQPGNQWKSISVQDREGWKKLEYAKGTYPSNPSLIKTSAETSPSHEEIIFDKRINKYQF